MLTREELIEIGVNPDNMTYPMGEMNVIVQCFGYEDGTFMNEEYIAIESNFDIQLRIYVLGYYPQGECILIIV